MVDGDRYESPFMDWWPWHLRNCIHLHQMDPTSLYHNFTFTQVATGMQIQIPIQVWWYDLLD